MILLQLASSLKIVAQFYMRNESAVYNRIAKIMKMAPMTAEKMADWIRK
jgi:hypothetical protein